jgi:alanine racemase
MLQELAQRIGLKARVHLKIDTGMGRLGVLPSRALELLGEIRSSTALELAGVMTHISAPDGARSESSAEQLALFEDVLREARARRLLRGWVHAANSAALFTGLTPAYDTVRPGISAYGVLPDGIAAEGELRPVLSVRSQVVFLKDVPAGAAIGYGSTWRAPRATRIATVPVGYNDGVPWRLSNRGEVLVRGRRAPLVGLVSMDYVTIDVGEVPGVEVGDRVTLIGGDGDERIRVADVARHAGTIAYEITCSVGKRVRRRYQGGEDLSLAAQAPALPALSARVAELLRKPAAPRSAPV